MNKKSTGLLLSILGVLSLVLITAGVTYAFFSYAKEGETTNTLTTGTITFYYDEKNGAGKGINIEEAMPMDDNAGMALVGDTQVFDFQITSEVSKGAKIPYLITVRRSSDSTLDGDKVKVYLDVVDSNSSIAAGSSKGTVKNNGDKNYTLTDAGDISLFSQLEQVTNADNDSSQTTVTGSVGDKVSVTVPKDIDERKIYEGVVPTNSVTNGGTGKYTANFRLRMWISGDTDEEGNIAAADYSPYEFVLQTAESGSQEALDADSLINSQGLITSTAYYSLDEEAKKGYERIAYVNKTARTIYTVSQAVTKGWITETGEAQSSPTTPVPDGFERSEQFYSLNGQKFTLTVNVYANAAVVEATD